MSEERTERASPRRRQKAAEQGDRVRSRELVTAAALTAGVWVLGQILTPWVGRWSCSYGDFLALGLPSAWQEDHLAQTLSGIRNTLAVGLAPLLFLFAAVTAASLLAGVAQSRGIRFNFQAIQPKWERINPASNIKNLFSLRGATRLGKSLLPAAVLAILAVHKIGEQTAIPPLSVDRLPKMFITVYDILLDTALILLIWSGVDYLVEWRSYESRLKMSKQEMREEHKNTEGNPQIRGKIRSLRRQMRRRKLQTDVSRASVVITNPTHYAVALSFDFETMEPPKVLAKGRNLFAEQIKTDARWAGIPIVENPPLARSLYRHVEPGQTIPMNLYAAVAAILAYLYRQQVEDRVRQEEARRRANENNSAAEKEPVIPPSARLQPVQEKL